MEPQSTKLVLYIANCSRWKSFMVAELNCNSLENICGWPFFFYNLLSEGNYFTGKVSRLPTNPQKPRNFSTSNNLQYTVQGIVAD